MEKNLQKDMDKSTVSVIVPVYKAEKYISKCVSGILDQDYPNLELILVEDGSPDKSGDLCDQLALKDKRIKVLHQMNMGPMKARTNGVRQATGEFICFVDADDTIAPDSFSTMMSYMNNDTDIVILEGNEEGDMDITQYAVKLLHFNLWTIWGKLFRRQLWDEYVMGVPEYFKVGEDFLTQMRLLKNIQGKIHISKERKYNYNTENPNSIQLSHKTSYEYEMKMISEVDAAVRQLAPCREIEEALYRWQLVYLGGMIGLGYPVDFKARWICNLSLEKRFPTNWKEKMTLSAIRHSIPRIFLKVDKRGRTLARRMVYKIRAAR